VKRFVAVVISALVFVSPLAATINPTDQGYAVRFSPKPNDLGSGWRTTRPNSTKLRSEPVRCRACGTERK
jgi:hypothetical protein